jgi:hypothetical protein
LPEPLIAWEPQVQQAKFINCPADDVGFGGARGGGKSDAVIGDWVNHSSLYGEHAIGLCVRRQRTELVELIERAKTILLPLKFKWYEQDKIFRSPNASRLRFSYLESDADADAYQGHSYSRLYVEEAGTFPNEAPINKLQATLRSGHGVPCQMKTTCNPGGPGHQWVKARYGLVGRPKTPIIKEIHVENPFTKKIVTRTRAFIPSKVVDNKFIDQERYVAGLQQTGSAQLVDAWLHGDWDVIQGAFFDCWNYEKHVVKPFEIPDTWLRFRSGDWGSAKPFSIGWWAVASDDHNGIPRGALIRYREWYGSTGQPNTGLKYTAEQVALGILERESAKERTQIKYSTLDPAAFAQDGGPSIAERMAVKGVNWSRADNKRVSRKGAMGGWDQMRARMVGTGRPMIYCFDTCLDSIRTIPALQHDPDNLEDLDTDGEDHAGDEWRYACMSRPWIPREQGELPAPKYELQAMVGPSVDGTTVIAKSTETVRQIFDRHFKRRNDARRFG